MVSPLPAAAEANKPRLLDQVRELMRLRHYSICTEEAFVEKKFCSSAAKDIYTRDLHTSASDDMAGG
jgi:hypothetical protein